MLATMNPENEIFRKDYVKPKNTAAVLEGEDPDLVANTDDWFLTFPRSTAPTNGRRKSSSRILRCRRRLSSQGWRTSRLC